MADSTSTSLIVEIRDRKVLKGWWPSRIQGLSEVVEVAKRTKRPLLGIRIPTDSTFIGGQHARDLPEKHAPCSIDAHLDAFCAPSIDRDVYPRCRAGHHPPWLVATLLAGSQFLIKPLRFQFSLSRSQTNAPPS